MNRESTRESIMRKRPAAMAVGSALIALTFLLGACGGGSNETATPAAAAATPTLVATAVPLGTQASGTTSNAGTTPSAGTGNGALTETVQAAASTGITAGTI